MQAGDTAFIPKGAVQAWKNIGTITGRLRYIFSPALDIEEMFRTIHAANEGECITEAVLLKLAIDFPDQETVGPPL